MKKTSDRPFWKRIAVDVAGCILVIAAPFVGLIPGPGGIIVFIAGLGLLASNHEWAERWLDRVKKEGANIYDKIFPENIWARRLYDILALSLISGAAYWLITHSNRKLVETVLLLCTTFGFILLLFNRRRAEKLSAVFRKNKNKN